MLNEIVFYEKKVEYYYFCMIGDMNGSFYIKSFILGISFLFFVSNYKLVMFVIYCVVLFDFDLQEVICIFFIDLQRGKDDYEILYGNFGIDVGF